MRDTEEIDMISQKEGENITSTRRTAVIKREKETDEDELGKELGGVDDLAENDDEDSDQEYTTKKKKVEKKKEPVFDSAFQSRLVSEDQSLLFFCLNQKFCSFLSHLERRPSEEI